MSRQGHHLIRIPVTTCDFKEVTLASDEGQYIMAHRVIVDAARHFVMIKLK